MLCRAWHKAAAAAAHSCTAFATEPVSHLAHGGHGVDLDPGHPGQVCGQAHAGARMRGMHDLVRRPEHPCTAQRS